MQCGSTDTVIGKASETGLVQPITNQARTGEQPPRKRTLSGGLCVATASNKATHSTSNGAVGNGCGPTPTAKQRTRASVRRSRFFGQSAKLRLTG